MKNFLTQSAFGLAVTIAGAMALGGVLQAQAPSNGGPGASQPAASQQNPAADDSPSRVKSQSNQNPFPEDTESVPVMPNASSGGTLPSDVNEAANTGATMPVDDNDPVRSPETEAAAAEASESNSSSSLTGLGNLLPPADDDAKPVKRDKKGRIIEADHQETAAEDESVGDYYLEKKDWKAALSRFQSALVLDPDNPDVYWGLAECARHMGNLADARAYYLKLVDYDPDSRHGKEARKLLKDPEIANAKVASGTAAPPQ